MKLILFILSIDLIVNCLGVDRCGIRPEDNSEKWRIVGGHNSKPGSWPWMASIRLKESSDFKVCGATLFNQQWILVAAHCVRIDDNPINWLVGLDAMNDTLLGVTKIVIHPKASAEHGIFNDIALIQLNQTLDFDNETHKYLTPICLSNRTDIDLSSYQCVITGWGRPNAEGVPSNTLQEAIVPIVNSTICFEKFGFKIDINTNLCADGLKGGGLGTCIGDSGGPLQCRLSDKKWYQFGIISWGISCAKPGIPDVFTKVSAYIDWIQEIVYESTLN